AIQKDNQNTVTISTVNKIGLSNTQQLYYLYKATANMVQPVWPTRNAVVTKVSDFKAYASTISYQGYDVTGAKDSVTCVSVVGDATCRNLSLEDMGYLDDSNGGRTFSSKRDIVLAEGRYQWYFRADSRNFLGNESSSDFDVVSFSVDNTAPHCSLYVDREFVNPDSVNFIARFTSADSMLDVRAMRLQLRNMSSQKVVPGVRDLYDVSNKDFAVSWDGVDKGNLKDGLYSLELFAVDYAAPSSSIKATVDMLANGIARNAKTDSLWSVVVNTSDLNKSHDTVSFIIDRSSPSFENRGMDAVYKGDCSLEERKILKGPEKKFEDLKKYVNGDELLEVSYHLNDSLFGRDSVPIIVSFAFEHLSDSSLVSRVGDSVWIKKAGGVDSSWSEMYSMRLGDGDYKVGVMARDMAGNINKLDSIGHVRVDRTAPQISGLLTTSLVYPESVHNFGASFNISEASDVASNRTGVNCYYRVSGKDSRNGWNRINPGVVYGTASDSVSFSFDMSIAGSENGKRYLEVACVDVAGNIGRQTTLFHIGSRSPVITSPQNNSASDKRIIVVEGIAPPLSGDSAEYYYYRLRYRNLGTTEWKTDSAFVIPSLRASENSRHNYSRMAQSNDGVLGYIFRDARDNGGYEIELGVGRCDETSVCKWVVDVDTVSLMDVKEPSLELVLNSSKRDFEVDADSIKISARLKGDFSNAYHLRVYAEDENHAGLFEEARNVWQNPFSGAYDSDVYASTERGVWIYEENDRWNVRWKGFGDSGRIAVGYLAAVTEFVCDSRNGVACMHNRVDMNETGAGVKLGSTIDSMMAEMGVEYNGTFPELRPLINSDFEMVLAGDSGHVSLRTDSAFRVFAPNFDSSTTNIPVYMGMNSIPGFVNYGLAQEVMKPLLTGMTINPENYGIVKFWNGVSSNGIYPKQGKIYLYAEASENISTSPNVVLKSDTLMARLPKLQVALQDTLPSYSIVDPSKCSGGKCTLGNMTAKFGIKYHDARVKAYIMEGADTVKALDPVDCKASDSPTANLLHWNGTSDGKVTVGSGPHRLVIVAVSKDDVKDTAYAEASFEIAIAPGKREMENDGYSSPMIRIVEAGDSNRYEPVADYLVTADLSGWYLPKVFRDTLSITAKVSGKQNPLGFRPKRFSLAAKRHRERLDLVIVAKLEIAVVSADCYGSGVEEEGYETRYFIRKLSFDSTSLSQKFEINSHIGNIGGGRGLSGTRDNYLTLSAYLSNSFGTYNDSTNLENLPDNVQGLTKVWSKDSLKLPLQTDDNDFSKDVVSKVYENDDVKCIASLDSSNGFVEFNDCNLDNNAYDPNARLFNVYLNPIDRAFYSGMGEVNNGCLFNDAERNERVKFELKLTIPEKAYWNAPFGMDNLVNRTVRFDHTNQTMFGNDGYLKALFDEFGRDPGTRDAIANYFDGSVWNEKFSPYGMLTPFEAQRFVYLPASWMQGGLNTFLFADEDAYHVAKSAFDLRFYNFGTETEKFVVKMHGNKNNVLDTATYVMPDSVRTPYYDESSAVYFYVGMNKNWSSVSPVEDNQVDYPAPLNWRASMKDACMDGYRAEGVKSYEAPCSKYYEVGSKIHYYVGDYTDEEWLNAFTHKDGIIKNYVNNNNAVNPRNFGSIREGYADSIVAKINDNNVSNSEKISLSSYLKSKNYKDGRFFIDLKSVDSLKKILDRIPESVKNGDGFSMGYGPDVLNDTLFVETEKWSRNIDYRRTMQGTEIILPTPTQPTSLSIHDLYRYQSWSRGYLCGDDDLYCGSLSKDVWEKNDWVKDFKVNSVALKHLDSSMHSHFTVSTQGDESDLRISYKSKVDSARPAEFVELRGNLNPEYKYSISYLTEDTVFCTFWEGNVSKSGEQRIDWFNMSRLNGNTTFMLSWGGENDSLYFKRTQLDVGKAVEKGKKTTVRSLFGELEVTFPENSSDKYRNITVRTADVKDYTFDVFNKISLTGPIVEVLPSMEFTGPEYPRVQMKISAQELNNMHVTPQTLRLYKADFKEGKLVPLVNALYGYLKNDGGPAGKNGKVEPSCSSPLDDSCYPQNGDWAYMLISAETRTFSVFVAL
ncbi:MAG: hypothetical protein HUK20_07950, partial [Fibrobacter sp.]|nr:hypothetical protein [Fibrobacter sp.]